VAPFRILFLSENVGIDTTSEIYYDTVYSNNDKHFIVVTD